METKEKKVYQAMLVVCALIIGLLMICVDVNARKVEETQKEITENVYYKMGNDLENYVIDVVFETDIFDDITEDEQKYLDELWDEKDPGLYYIELIKLCEKYYGDK